MTPMTPGFGSPFDPFAQELPQEPPQPAPAPPPPEDRSWRGRVRKSWKITKRLADHFLAQGYGVILKRPRIAPSFEEREGYGDEYDLQLVTNYEVKGRTFNFTCREDCPEQTLFLDRVEKADKNKDVVHFYATVSDNKEYCAILDANATRHLWTKRRVWDNKAQHWVWTYECDIEYWTFGPMEEDWK